MRGDGRDLTVSTSMQDDRGAGLHMGGRHSQAALAALTDIAADAVIVLDERFSIVRFNQGAERTFGWSEAEMLGQKLDRLLPEGLRGAHSAHVHHFASGVADARRMGERRSISGMRKNGDEFPAEASIARVTVDGERTFMVVLRDVSERARVDAGQRLLARTGRLLAASLDLASTVATIAELPLPLLADWSLVELFDDEGRVRRAAAAHRQSEHGLTVESLVSTAFTVGSTERGHWDGESGEPGDATHVSASGESWLASVFADEATRESARALGVGVVLSVPMHAGGRAIGELHLVRSRADASFLADDRALGEQLAASASLALENTRLYQESRRAVHERDELLAIVSHDLRNPVNAIVMLAGGLMALSEDGASVPVELEQLRSVRAAARQADKLIEDLQDVSRITTSRLSVDVQPIDIAEVIRESVQLCTPVARERQLELSCTIPSELTAVSADRARVQQVLTNLLMNAITFTPVGGAVDVMVDVLSSAAQLRVAVRDTGPGIAPEDVPRLFERYWQAPRLLRTGSGLGLFIVKGIVDAHGGTIDVKTELGVGTTFSFTLRLA